jgi:uncharacterized protein (DUF2236 family)
MADPIAQIRTALQGAIRNVLVGETVPVRDLSKPLVGDTGLFGPESATWRIHADASMLIGGIRALMLQTLHPLAMAGVADHSAYRTDTSGRLWRTTAFVGITTFGTTDEAKQSVAMVKRVHERVKGTAPDGRTYSANDPHLMAWVHHCLVDSFLTTYQRFGERPLAKSDADRYVSEQARLARLLGTSTPAESVTELKQWFRDIQPELKGTPTAREATRYMLNVDLSLPLVAKPIYGVIAAAAVSILPRFARRELRFPTLPLTEGFAVRPAARVITRGVGWAMSAPMP